MKKLIQYSFFIALSAIIISACSSQRTAVSPQVSRTDVTGTWTVSSVNLQGFEPGYSIGRIFDMADYQDFQGSTWVLKGNYTGTITLSNGTTQEIYWSINNNSFQFKKLMDGEKPKTVTSGYRLEFGDMTKENAVFKTPVTYNGGQTGYVNFNFSKS